MRSLAVFRFSYIKHGSGMHIYQSVMSFVQNESNTADDIDPLSLYVFVSFSVKNWACGGYHN